MERLHHSLQWQFAPIAGSEFEMNVDLVLLAMGFTGPVKTGLLTSLGARLDARGNVAVDHNFMTTIPRVFAAGVGRFLSVL